MPAGHREILGETFLGAEGVSFGYFIAGVVFVGLAIWISLRMIDNPTASSLKSEKSRSLFG